MDSQQSFDDTPIYCPQVKVDLIPIKNQEFQTLQDVETFYKSYAKEARFNVKSSVTEKKNGVIVRKEYVCSKEGTSKVTGKKRNRNQTRENCKARIAVVRRAKIGKYVVTIFVEDHSHPLTSPRRQYLTKIHRKVSAVHKSLSKQLTEVNVPTCTQFDFLRVNSRGLKNIVCLQQDIYNYKRDCHKEVKGHDGDMLYEYFLHEKEKDPSFIFKIEADNENRITRIFWADAISRRSYKFFGDVVIFDTTYNTNTYSLIFAPLVGVNNHGQTIILACAFLNNETTDSFTWFFKEFLKAMSGDAPRMIITDQDPAMTKAISEVLPQTFHRLSDQYILKRWTKSAKSEIVLDDAGVEITDNRDLLARRSQLCQYAVEVIDKIVGNEEASAMFLDSLDSVLEKYTSMMADVRAKGCEKRLKAGKEKGRLKAAKKANGKGRFCHGCKKHDQQHDKRNCPKLKNKDGILIAQTGEDTSDLSTDEEEYSSRGVDQSV
ncbi:PREDICTED: protein FAR1-RELATED SEQUENCE 5-like [Fragaria vesca subsp. vesca]